MRTARFLCVGLIGASAAMAPAAAQASGPCAKQESILKHAKTKAAKAKAKKALEKCKKANALIVVSPANPYVDENVTITIHPRSPLPAGYVYSYVLSANGGSLIEEVTKLVIKETTSRSVEISPRDAAIPHKEWADGKGSVIVSEEIPGNEESIKPIGLLTFRFIEKP
jgi:hypothetical protein